MDLDDRTFYPLPHVTEVRDERELCAFDVHLQHVDGAIGECVEDIYGRDKRTTHTNATSVRAVPKERDALGVDPGSGHHAIYVVEPPTAEVAVERCENGGIARTPGCEHRDADA